MKLTEEQKVFILDPYIKELEDKRKERALPYREVSERSGYDIKYISLIEKRERVPSIMAMAAVASALGFKRDFIRELVEDMLDEFEWKE